MTKKHQSGVALITALLVVALVTTAAVAMAARQQLDIRRTANTLQRDQAYAYAVGAEVMAKEVLGKDDAKLDSLDEDWAFRRPPIPFQGGILSGEVEDLQGRFNLNNLVTNDGKRSEFDAGRFANLLQIAHEQSKQKNPDAVEDNDPWKDANINDLVNAVVDWLDVDSDPLAGGAEDGDYLQGERPYRSANGLMSATSELLLVKGFNAGIYADLAPYITALPMRTLINVNTAKPEVVRALEEKKDCFDKSKIPNAELLSPSAASLSSVSGADEEIKPKAFKSLDNFMLEGAFAGCKFLGIKENKKNPAPAGAPKETPKTPAANEQDPSTVLSVNSSFFLVNAYAEVGSDDHRMRVKLFSVLQRNQASIATITRTQGTY